MDDIWPDDPRDAKELGRGEAPDAPGPCRDEPRGLVPLWPAERLWRIETYVADVYIVAQFEKVEGPGAKVWTPAVPDV